MSEELNRQVAERLGYSVYHYDKDYAENCYYQLVDESFTPVIYAPHYATGQRKTEAEAWADAPSFTGSMDAVRFVEDEIERRGLQREYTNALMDIVTPGALDSRPRWLWELLRATPEQRCRAALKALEAS